MTPERWQQIKEVLDQALELEPEKRAAFLDRACSAHPSVRKEVEQLLVADGEARSNFLLSYPFATLAMTSGTRLGDYEVLCLLGSGGMGEVYRARDRSLGRDVAIKVLPWLVASDRDRLRRFEQEARAAAALNHPNILTVYQLGTYEGTPYIVSELLEGKTLRQDCEHGALPLRKAIDYAVQTARGLAAAHEKQIVHRDLKPENLFVTKDGRVKILDFGLAKLTQPHSGSEHSVPTRSDGTEPGTLLGTVGYMAPEQVRGQATDHRSDIFAFGAILYEMLTGKRAFHGETAADTMSAILHGDPPSISQLTPELPPSLQRIVVRCLEKKPEQRFQSASDLTFALEALSNYEGQVNLRHQHAAGIRTDRLRRDTDSGHYSVAGRATLLDETRSRATKSWRLIAGIGLVILGLISLAIWFSRTPSPPRVTEIKPLTNDGQPKYPPLFSDGPRLYFREGDPGRFLLYQVSSSGGETARMPSQFGTMLDISPDRSKFLAGEFTAPLTDVPIWVLPLPQGAPRAFGNLIGHDATWSPDGETVAYAKGYEIYVASGDGSNSHRMAVVEGWPYAIRWSPNGKTLRFSQLKNELRSLWELSSNGSNPHLLLSGWSGQGNECCGNWTADGKYYIFEAWRGERGDIWAIRESGSVINTRSGEPVRLTTGPINFSGSLPSQDGKRIFVDGYTARGEVQRYDAKSKQFVPYLRAISAEGLDFSRDGQLVAYVTAPDGILWRSTTNGSDLVQLTGAPMRAGLPRWSPDGKRIAFMGRNAGGLWKIYIVSSDGGSLQQITYGGGNDADPSWSPDGASLAYGGNPNLDPASPMSIRILDLRTNQTSKMPGSDGLFSPRWSFNGRYLVALSADASKLMLYSFVSRKWEELAKIKANYFSWSLDSRYLYFTTLESPARFMRVKAVGEHRMEKLASLKDVRLFMGSFGWWTGLAPDNSLLILRDTSADEIYGLDVQLP